MMISLTFFPLYRGYTVVMEIENYMTSLFHFLRLQN